MHSLSRSQAKLIRRLHERKHREREGLFLAEGVRLVGELARSDVRAEFVAVSPTFMETERGRSLIDALSGSAVPSAICDEAELHKLAATETPQGILAVARVPDGELADFEPTESAAILVLDGLGDPGNCGTLVRAAHGLGASCVMTLPSTVDAWNPKAVRASAGSLFRLPVLGVAWPQAADWLRARDFDIFGADPRGDPVSRSETPLFPRFALVIGSEAAGLSNEVRESCDRLLAVELVSGVESLNAALAGALLLDRLRVDPNH